MSSWLDSIAEVLPIASDVESASPVGGGCISDAQKLVIKLREGGRQTLFAKSNDASFLDNFQCEADGLQRLAAVEAIRVPSPVAVGIAGDAAVLVLEWIETGRRGSDFFAAFGRQLAQLHHKSLGDAIGLDRDNYLGSARQINASADNWPSFFAEHRIEYQLRWAVDQGLASERLRRDVQQIIDRMESLLAGREEATSLLHGDLWSGNYLSDDQGRPVIIDPAVYYGCREAEFGMLKLFGACPADFYEAYEEAFPLPAGWQQRVSVYLLYHLLNHLNLFGSGYRSQCESVAAQIL